MALRDLFENKLVFFRLLLLWIGLLGIIAVAGCAQKKVNDRQPAWSKESGLVSSGNFRSVALADLDNDGNLDVIGGSSSPGTVAIWYGNGTGGMSAPQYLPFKGDVRSIAVADFDENGFKDIVLSVQKEASGIMVWLNQGERKWVRGVSPTEINNYEGVKTADVNGDGHMDIIAANVSSDIQGGIQVWLGDGKGNWRVESGPTITGAYMDITLADFDHDGFLDLAAAGWGIDGALKVWLGDGAGGWSSTSPVSKGSFYGLSVGDVDGDGNLDILAGSYREGPQIFLGDGKGGFIRAMSPQESIGLAGEPDLTLKDNYTKASASNDAGSFWQVICVDLDGDSRMDLLGSTIDSRGIKAWSNQGKNAWSSIKGRFPTTGSYYGIAIGDLNKDGFDDIVAASYGEGIKIWLAKENQRVSSKVVKTDNISLSEAAPDLAETKENSVFKTISGVPQYKIGPNDIIQIKLWQGSVATEHLVMVRPDGKILFGLIDNLFVQGLTASELDDVVTTRLKEFIKNPRVDVLVKEHKSKFVRITGPGASRTGVVAGGKIALTGKITIVTMLSEFIDLSIDANLTDVGLKRKNGQMLKLNLFKALALGETGQDVILDDGDLIYIPIISKEANRVYVFGQVGSPGAYSFRGSGISLLDVISQAGGVTLFAHEDSTKIVRGDPTRPEVISADLVKLLKEGDHTQNVALVNGDFVYVPRSFIGDVARFLAQITPLLQLARTPADILKVPKETRDAWHGAEDTFRLDKDSYRKIYPSSQ